MTDKTASKIADGEVTWKTAADKAVWEIVVDKDGSKTLIKTSKTVENLAKSKKNL